MDPLNFLLAPAGQVPYQPPLDLCEPSIRILPSHRAFSIPLCARQPDNHSKTKSDHVTVHLRTLSHFLPHQGETPPTG